MQVPLLRRSLTLPVDKLVVRLDPALEQSPQLLVAPFGRHQHMVLVATRNVHVNLHRTLFLTTYVYQKRKKTYLAVKGTLGKLVDGLVLSLGVALDAQQGSPDPPSQQRRYVLSSSGLDLWSSCWVALEQVLKQRDPPLLVVEIALADDERRDACHCFLNIF